MPSPPFDVNATEVAQYIRYNSCDRRFRLEYDDMSAAKKTVPFFNKFINPLDPVLQEKGRERENQWANQLETQGFDNINKKYPGKGISQTQRRGIKQAEKIHWSDLIDILKNISKGDPVFAREVVIEDSVGVFNVQGRIDFVVLDWNNNKPSLRIVEVKNSRKERTNQRIQIATYELLINNLVSSSVRIGSGSNKVRKEEIEYVVGRLTKNNNQIQNIINIDSANLRQEKEDVKNLLKSGGHLESVLTTSKQNIQNLDYQLEPKCDKCKFDVHCFGESGRDQRLELLGLGPSEIEALNQAGTSNAGITDIDDLASINLSSQIAKDIRQSDNIRQDVGRLKRKAEARLETLPGGASNSGYEVQQTHTESDGILPEHCIDGEDLIRVYLDVNYDYVEDRVVSLAAHITKSGWHISTDFKKASTPTDQDSDDEIEEEYTPDTDLKEMEPKPYTTPRKKKKRPYSNYNFDPIVEYIPTEWTGNQAVDDGMESNMIANFIRKIRQKIQNVATNEEEFVHFYLWAENEMEHLVDACARSSSNLLSDLRELLGCREPTEQLIYSSVRREIDRRYSMGWTGRGLIVASDLKWFGHRYHWVREVNGNKEKLNNIFRQNLFDYVSSRYIDNNGDWTHPSNSQAQEFRFELRSRFYDSLPIPYMHSLWGTLPKPNQITKQRKREAVKRFHRVSDETLEAYLGARTHALRWLEERCAKKNSDIVKKKIDVSQLPNRNRKVNNCAVTAGDFLLLDHHSRKSEWIGNRLEPLSHQVSMGEAVVIDDGLIPKNEDNTLNLSMDFSNVSISKSDFKKRTNLDEESFVHLSVTRRDVDKGPSIKQLTKTAYVGPVKKIDWSSGKIEMEVLPTNNIQSPFLMSSNPVYAGSNHKILSTTFSNPPDKFILTESISDYPSKTSYRRIRKRVGSHAYNWFDPMGPSLPNGPKIDTYHKAVAEYAVTTYKVDPSNTLNTSQAKAVTDGLDSRVQLLLGPPGTGKTTTSALAVLTRIWFGKSEGDVVLVVGSTHRAVNELLNSIDEHISDFRSHSKTKPGKDLGKVECVKVVSDMSQSSGVNNNVEVVEYGGNSPKFKKKRKNGILILGGTTSSIIQEIEDLSNNKTWGKPSGPFLANELIIDEASMMKYPHFLASCSLVNKEARVLVVGDHRQLSPIVARDWEEEKRPSIQKYEPHRSAFESVRSLKTNYNLPDEKIIANELDYTHRLEQIIQSLIRPLYLHLDDVDLSGKTSNLPFKPSGNKPPIPSLWEPDTGLFLIRHNENRSRVSNLTEVELIDDVLDSAPTNIDDDSVAIITPHTAQKAQLKDKLTSKYSNIIKTIDTVEKLQGGEAETVIVSATASDKTAISNYEDFILDLNRANVAFSRAEKRLIVLCSETLMDYIPPELENYESSLLWKTLRRICSDKVGNVNVSNYSADILAPDKSVKEVQDVL